MIPHWLTESAGLAVLFHYLARARSGYSDEEISAKYLDQAIEALANTPLRPGLHGAFTEIAWACEHLSSGVSNTVVDSALKKHLKQKPWNDDYDLLLGLVGIGVEGLGERRTTS